MTVSILVAGLLVGFYVIFLSCLAAFVAVLSGFVILVIDKNYPTRQDLASMIKANPGMYTYCIGVNTTASGRKLKLL